MSILREGVVRIEQWCRPQISNSVIGLLAQEIPDFFSLEGQTETNLL